MNFKYFPKVFLIALFCGIFFSLSVKGQKNDEILSKIFFNTNLSRKDTALINYFDNEQLLHKEPDSTFINNLPSNEIAGKFSFYAYGFTLHPYFKTNLIRGKIIFTAVKVEGNALIPSLSIQLLFENEKTQDSVFLNLSKHFTTNSLHESISMGMPFDYKMIKFNNIYNQTITILKSCQSRMGYTININVSNFK